ncbi:unnamed protein product, partial [Ilex paraguariensis]
MIGGCDAPFCVNAVMDWLSGVSFVADLSSSVFALSGCWGWQVLLKHYVGMLMGPRSDTSWMYICNVHGLFSSWYTVFGGCPHTWTGFSMDAFSGAVA